jgi:hypothetical protein
VLADKTGLEIHKIPFGRRRRQHIAGVNTELVEDSRQLVHEGDVEIALGILDHLGSLGHLDRWSTMNTGCHHRTIDVGDNVEAALILRGYHLHNRFKAMVFVTGIDALGRITDGKIAARR